MYTMVIHRRFLRDEDEENVDYTDSVVEEMGGKETPELPPGFVPVDVNNPPPPPFAAAYPPQPTLPPQPSPPTTDLAPLPLDSLDALSSPPAAGPPIPAEGLPQGWTEDQWVHYGQKWLEENA
jgi:hypothetical protein